jgi:hypothetical protein
MTRHAAPSESLATRINDAERHLLERQRSVRVQGRMLGHRIHERLTSPALLGSAVGLGFLLGNRTRGPGSDHSWLRMAMSAMPLMHTLFTTVNPSVPTRASSSSEFSE